jgi:hypothetical protein
MSLLSLERRQIGLMTGRKIKSKCATLCQLVVLQALYKYFLSSFLYLFGVRIIIYILYTRKLKIKSLSVYVPITQNLSIVITINYQKGSVIESKILHISSTLFAKRTLIHKWGKLLTRNNFISNMKNNHVSCVILQKSEVNFVPTC